MQSDNPFFRRYTPQRNSPNPWRWLAVLVGVFALGYLVYHIPFVHSRLAWRVDSFRSSIAQYFNPPEEAIFAPAEVATRPTAQPSATAQAVVQVTPTATFEPLPPNVMLEGFTFVTQQGRWNYCGPSTLAMALNFWGWGGDRDDIARVVKPGENNPNLDFIARGFKDKNVMPYEMENYVNEHTQFRSLTRLGGDIELLKRLVANGFPVLIEKGYYEADYRNIVDWLGHYLLVTGYDEAQSAFIVQDSWDRFHPGENVSSPYDEFVEGWRSFNYLFMVIYLPDREAELLALLGPWADVEWANRYALETARAETERLSGIDLYFAWFNMGTSHVGLFEYVDAAHAYDYAFQLYAALDDNAQRRPYRMMWYQTGPYWAYYYSGRYQDVINLANTTISVVELEESFYWRGLARQAIGETGNAVSDLRTAVYLNPNFGPGLNMLQQLGVAP
ncbi:MAG: C39 family peptidase [Anaerolineales bacterium]|nr:C39 family peptidase [Anaerolineales bacterium]